MEQPKLLSTKNIPEDVLIGKGKMTVLECKDKKVFEQLEQEFRGAIFHLSIVGRFYIKVDYQMFKMLKPYIEDERL